MAVKKNHNPLLKKLKKQVRVLQRKELQGRNKLRAALKKMRKLGKIYRGKLAGKVRSMKDKMAEMQASPYAKAAAEIERQMVKGIEAKGKSLRSALSRLEKKHIAKVIKSIDKKKRKAGKSKKSSRAAPKMKKTRRSMKRRSRS
jgi:hypothetical protein